LLPRFSFSFLSLIPLSLSLLLNFLSFPLSFVLVVRDLMFARRFDASIISISLYKPKLIPTSLSSLMSNLGMSYHSLSICHVFYQLLSTDDLLGQFARVTRPKHFETERQIRKWTQSPLVWNLLNESVTLA
jgi:hypothetical protein